MSRTPKPYNGGQWTEARMRAFIMSALRRASWPVKYAVKERAFIGREYNPKSGKMRKVFACEVTGKKGGENAFQVDHITPVVPNDFGETTRYVGYNWNEIMPRLFCEAEGLRVIGKEVHQQKTKTENQNRKKKK
jgi:hypothetical protein